MKKTIWSRYFENKNGRRQNAGYRITLLQDGSGYTVEREYGKINSLHKYYDDTEKKKINYDNAVCWFNYYSNKRFEKGYKLIKENKYRRQFIKKVKKRIDNNRCIQINKKEDRLQKVLEDRFAEGAEKILIQTTWERNSKLRKAAVIKYGTSCMVCGFDFNKRYGKNIGEDYIEVHHIKALSEYKTLRKTNIKDVIVVCSNCHRVIHRKKGTPLGWNQLRKIVMRRR